MGKHQLFKTANSKNHKKVILATITSRVNVVAAE